MSEADKKEVVEETPVENKVDEELQKALADGYDPDDPKGFSPGEFNRRGELLKSHNKMHKKIEKLEQELMANKSAVEAARAEAAAARIEGYNQALAELEAKRMIAVEHGNREQFAAADKEYQRIQNQLYTAQAAQAARPVINDPVAQEFVARHGDWFYGKDPASIAIQDVAKEFLQRENSNRFMQGLPAMNQREEAIKLESYLSARYPERFEAIKKAKPAVADVESADSPAVDSGKRQSTEKDLNANQLLIYKTIKAHKKDYTVDDYLDEVGATVVPLIAQFRNRGER